MKVGLLNTKEKKQNRKNNFWVSYADIMAGLLLMFVLILTAVIYDYHDALSQTQNQLDQIMGIRRMIIEALQQEFADTDLNLEIDPQTGAIRIPGGIFFAHDSDEIKDDGREYLKEFVPRYINILRREEFRDYISQIIIEGHTDDIGNYMYNLGLSQDRAYSVVEAIYHEDFDEFEYDEDLKEVLTANGRSFGQPIYKDDGETIDRDRSRRVEFQFRLKDEEMILEMQRILEESR